jgi:hypothetical protein
MVESAVRMTKPLKILEQYCNTRVRPPIGFGCSAVQAVAKLSHEEAHTFYSLAYAMRPADGTGL